MAFQMAGHPISHSIKLPLVLRDVALMATGDLPRQRGHHVGLALAVCVVVCRFEVDDLSRGGSPVSLWCVQSARSRRELEYSRTLQALHINAALRVAIGRF